MKKMFFLMLTLLMTGAAMNAQVAIGNAEGPRAGALLDLYSTDAGLILPTVSLDNIGDYQLSSLPNTAAVEGMVVYNDNEDIENGQGKGVYVWTGQWTFAGYRSGPTVVPVTGIAVTAPAEEIAVGNTLQFTAEFTPLGATNQTVHWSVINGTGTGGIDNDGLFTPESPGSVKIKAVSAENAAISGEKNIVVTYIAQEVETITVSAAGDAVSVVAGSTLQLSALVLPTDADNRSVRWTSDNTNLATVNENTGLVTGVAIGGPVRITATAKDGSLVYDDIELQVTPILVTSISITASRASVPYDGSVTLTATVLPSNAAWKAVDWHFESGPDGAMIDYATVTDLTCTLHASTNPGSIRVTAKAKDVGQVISPDFNINADIPVQVNTITVIGTQCVVDGGTTYSVGAITPDNAHNHAVTWSVTGAGTITYQDDEKCTVVGTGTGGAVTVIATAKDIGHHTGQLASYAVVGQLGPGDDIEGESGYTYTTYYYGNTVGRIMTQNSRETNLFYLTALSQEGYWYSPDDVSDAMCPDGWRVLRIADLDALLPVLRQVACVETERLKWAGNSQNGGYLNRSGSRLQSTSFAPAWTSSMAHYVSPSFTRTTTSMSPPGLYGSVRCVEL
ncbi:MAG: Ig-like domain-containing protein [Candidatus Symbiothrix sp.]|jgi:uncharacterized protein YjdB|nr:Ig-like domain-containing protein [Candidatus Symbiothrix sp.]